MAQEGWKRLAADWPWFHAEGAYPLPAYSERAVTPYLVRKPYGTFDTALFSDDDPWGWPITEYEDAFLLRPGLDHVAAPMVRRLLALLRRGEDLGIGSGTLEGNPYWSPDLIGTAVNRPVVFLLSLALAITQDDKGRLRWTFLGGSDEGPERSFWRSSFTAPNREVPADQALTFLRRLLQTAFVETDGQLANLRDAGLRILPDEADAGKSLPAWTEPLIWNGEGSPKGIRYVLTFRPYTRLPKRLQKTFLAGDVQLIPHPGTLAPWGALPYHRLRKIWPDALQLPLLQLSDRHEGLDGLRVPQSGWMCEPFANGDDPPPYPGHERSRHRRSRRHSHRRHFGENELADAAEDHLAHVLFSTAPDDVGLYDKPQARNVQIWTHDYQPLLNGNSATPEDIRRAGHALQQGGWFGYRFVFPPARVGRHEVVWHRPLVAHVLAGEEKAVLHPCPPLGYLTAYRADSRVRETVVEMWPRLLHRDAHAENVELFGRRHEDPPHATLLNVRKILDARSMWGANPIPPSFARQMLDLPKKETLERWLQSLSEQDRGERRAGQLVDELRRCLDAATPGTGPVSSLTYDRTARRSFELTYWRAIDRLSAGEFRAKNNGDPALDAVTRKVGGAEGRDLEALGDWLMQRHTEAIAKAGMKGRALVGQMPFRWTTHFDFPWLGGLVANRAGRACERNVMTVIPGRDRTQAVIMADHYDTAYIEDCYYRDRGGSGARLAAPGADDNGSATATLLLAAPVFLELSRAGRLGCDVWLLHLTGEEYPGEGLGARHLCEMLVEGRLQLLLPDGNDHDLSRVRVKGAFVLDMVGHNSRKGRDIFQISPGSGSKSMWLALQAHLATEAWNQSIKVWNRRPSRRSAGRGRRSRCAAPPIARHPRLWGEVRLPYDPRSTLYNTDAQEISDAGVPVVLLMENYDINRTGYHDSRDTLENVNLDYGAALAAIAIEAVARAAK